MSPGKWISLKTGFTNAWHCSEFRPGFGAASLLIDYVCIFFFSDGVSWLSSFGFTPSIAIFRGSKSFFRLALDV